MACFGTGKIVSPCASSDPQDSFYAMTVSGDTSQCTFEATIHWGDQTPTTVVRFQGGP